MNYDEEFYGDPSIEEINQVLQGLVSAGMVEMGVDNEGEFIFWMTDEQKDAIIEKMEEYRDYE
jgi:hypothetical protein